MTTIMKLKKIFFVTAIATTLTTACTIESSNNGNLDGFWHLESVDTLATNGTCDKSGERLFWGVQANLIHLQGAKEGKFYLRFAQSASELRLYNPHKDNWHQDSGDNGGDIPLDETNVNSMSEYGLNALEELFKIEKLNSKDMVLTNKLYRLKLKKF